MPESVTNSRPARGQLQLQGARHPIHSQRGHRGSPGFTQILHMMFCCQLNHYFASMQMFERCRRSFKVQVQMVLKHYGKDSADRVQSEMHYLKDHLCQVTLLSIDLLQIHQHLVHTYYG